MADYPCGHPRTAENTTCEKNKRCKTCNRERRKIERAQRTPGERRLEYRIRYLPHQLVATREKLRLLEVEAARYGMTDLLEAR